MPRVEAFELQHMSGTIQADDASDQVRLFGVL
jgi:hypothetical protein